MQDGNKRNIPIFLKYLTPDGNQRWFEDGDVLQFQKITKGNFYNGEFVFKDKQGKEILIRYSQLCRVYWDKKGEIYTPRLILPGGRLVEIVGLSQQKFLQLCEGKRLKTIRRKVSGSLYTTSTKRYKDIFIDERTEWRSYADCVDIVRERLVKPFLEGDVDKLKEEGGSWSTPLFDIEVLD